MVQSDFLKSMHCRKGGTGDRQEKVKNDGLTAESGVVRWRAGSSGHAHPPTGQWLPRLTRMERHPGCRNRPLLRRGHCRQARLTICRSENCKLAVDLKRSWGQLMGSVSEHGVFIYLKINWLKNELPRKSLPPR